MTNKTINISSAGLKNVVLNRFTEEDNFIMIFGEQEIRMNWIFADFISPVISHLHQSDPTINSFNFSDSFSTKTSDFNIFAKDILSSDVISLIQAISSGFSVTIDDSQAFKLRFLSIILGNEELFMKINESFPPDISQENFDTYIDYIQICYHFSQFTADFDFSSLIDYISEYYYKIPESKFLKLPRNIQYDIISNPHLQITSEDSLLDTIITIIHEDQITEQKVPFDSVSFLEHVEFPSLSEVKLRDFLRTFDFNTITNSLWSKLYECFFIHFGRKPERIENKRLEKHTFDYVENQSNGFNGIINFLTEKFGGNVAEKSACKVNSSSVFQNYVPKNVFNFSNANSFSTDSTVDKNNPWIKIDFLNRSVHPTFYTIKTRGNKRGDSHLKNWVLEGSNTDTENDWKLLDSRNNEYSLNDSFAQNTFRIKNKIEDNEYFRFLRIRQTGLNCRGTNQMTMGSLEFFGTII